ncbi:MAG TPA: hypothetical protein VGK17_03640 [Propionicimonas sp.]
MTKSFAQSGQRAVPKVDFNKLREGVEGDLVAVPNVKGGPDPSGLSTDHTTERVRPVVVKEQSPHRPGAPPARTFLAPTVGLVVQDILQDLACGLVLDPPQQVLRPRAAIPQPCDEVVDSWRADARATTVLEEVLYS